MSLFELKLNNEGVKAINGIVKLVRWGVILTIIITAILLLESWTTFFLTLNADYYGNKLVRFHGRIYPLYLSVYAVLVYFQTSYLLKAAKLLSVSIEANDEFAFNRAFVFLLKNIFFNLVVLVLALLMTIFRVLAFIIPYNT